MNKSDKEKKRSSEFAIPKLYLRIFNPVSLVVGITTHQLKSTQFPSKTSCFPPVHPKAGIAIAIVRQTYGSVSRANPLGGNTIGSVGNANATVGNANA